MTEDPLLQISLPAVPDNVAVVRQALAGVGDAYGIDPGALTALKVAVSEACTNVVVHAYRDGSEPGPLEVDADVEDETVTVTVRDRGSGMMPRVDSPGIGLGLPLIAALSHTMEFRGTEGGGTEVSMCFRLDEGHLVDAEADP